LGRITRLNRITCSKKVIIRSKAKALKEALNGLVVQVSAKAELKDPLEHQEEVLVNLIHVQ
jgi:hypothetical protein